jgi:hypothetical protein
MINIGSNGRGQLDDLDAPVPGSDSGLSVLSATTGEVNLYPDPSTFGTAAPRFYADCEGLFGAEPVAAKHQKIWQQRGRKYLIEDKDGVQVDRSMAVKTIYPKFLYIFSDVVCMVTRNPKAWAEDIIKLLEWSSIGAHHTVNQYALPAAIIVLNAPQIENESWVSDDPDALTWQFFDTISREIETNTRLRDMASKVRDHVSYGFVCEEMLIPLSTELAVCLNFSFKTFRVSSSTTFPGMGSELLRGRQTSFKGSTTVFSIASSKMRKESSRTESRH